MKIKTAKLPIILIAIVIILQIFLVNPSVALNSFYAMGAPLSLVPLLTPTTNPITGVYTPTNYYCSLFTSLHMEHMTRSTLTGEYVPDIFNLQGHEALQSECLFFAFIWCFLIVEIYLFFKCYKRSIPGKYLALLSVPAISVNIWAELIYILCGQTNAVVSFGIAFGLYLVVYFMISSILHKEKEASNSEVDSTRQ